MHTCTLPAAFACTCFCHATHHSSFQPKSIRIAKLWGLPMRAAKCLGAKACHGACRQAAESREALEVARAKEAAAEAKHKEAEAKLAGLLAREQAVADHKQQHAAALQATEAADQVCSAVTSRRCSMPVLLHATV